MNYTQNDRGETVIAEGAPGSLARVRCERPELIRKLNNLYFEAAGCYGRAVDEAIQKIREVGVTDYHETNLILAASEYNNEPPGSVTKLIQRL